MLFSTNKDRCFSQKSAELRRCVWRDSSRFARLGFIVWQTETIFLARFFRNGLIPEEWHQMMVSSQTMNPKRARTHYRKPGRESEVILLTTNPEGVTPCQRKVRYIAKGDDGNNIQQCPRVTQLPDNAPKF